MQEWQRKMIKKTYR